VSIGLFQLALPSVTVSVSPASPFGAKPRTVVLVGQSSVPSFVAHSVSKTWPIHALAAHPGAVWCLPDPAVAVLSASRANYQVFSVSGWFGEIAHRRLCARGRGDQSKKSKKEKARIEK
jgi:hypothetical protein